MKKMLSILSAMGLVAVASTSVVSCTKKADVKKFRSISDFNGKNYDDLLVDEDFKNGTIISENLIGILSSKFTDSEDAYTKLDDLLNGNVGGNPAMEIKVDPEIVREYDDYQIIKIHLSWSQMNSSFTIKKSTNKDLNRLSLDRVKKENTKIDLWNSDGVITSELISFGNIISSYKQEDREKNKDDIIASSNILFAVDKMLYKLADDNSKFLPGFRNYDHDKSIYKSVQQQIFDDKNLSKARKAFTDKVFELFSKSEKLKTPNTQVNQSIINDIFKDWNDKTLNDEIDGVNKLTYGDSFMFSVNRPDGKPTEGNK